MQESEVGITNLGPVPAGMTFAEATDAVRHLRKHRIDPGKRTKRLTICDTIRETWRIVEAMPDGPAKLQVLDYLAACFDYAKRMNARMIELKDRG